MGDFEQYSCLIEGILQDRAPPFQSYYNEEFQQESLLGHGGFGAVYKVTNKLDGQQYAVKRIPLNESNVRKLSRDEVKALANLKHLNVVRYYKAWTEKPPAQFFYQGEPRELLVDIFRKRANGPENERSNSDDTDRNDHVVLGDVVRSLQELPSYRRLFIQMELLSKSLRDFLVKRNEALVEGVLSDVGIDKALDTYHQLADGVKYIHEKGLMHRDLKPENVFFALDGTVKIADFGLAVLVDSRKRYIRGIGTKHYISPEQCGSSPGVYNEKTDIYSLGVILFELVYPMKTAERRDVVLTDLNRGNFPANFKAPINFVSAIRQMIENDPGARRLVSRLRRHIEESLPSSFGVPSQERVVSRSRRLTSGSILTILVLCLGLLFFLNSTWPVLGRKWNVWKICMKHM